MIDESAIEPIYPGAPALDLANAFLKTHGRSDPEEVENTRCTVLMAGQHLFETTGPSTWEQFQARGFFDKIDFMSDHEQIGVGLVLIGFYGWMIFAELLGPAEAVVVIEAIADAAPPSDSLRRMCRRAGELFLPLAPS